MHYILEKINNTLSDWDKTHDLKLYTGINENQTTMSFAYYPQFWLPNDHRPGFDKAIYQLIKWYVLYMLVKCNYNISFDNIVKLNR